MVMMFGFTSLSKPTSVRRVMHAAMAVLQTANTLCSTISFHMEHDSWSDSMSNRPCDWLLRTLYKE